MEYVIKEYTDYNEEELLALYDSVGWTNYTDRPELLRNAYANSLLTLGAYDGEGLIGIIRAVGDGYSVVFVQDILVLPAQQRRGVGTALLREVMRRFDGVYQLELLTDNTPKTVAFYESMGLTNAAELGCLAFVRM